MGGAADLPPAILYGILLARGSARIDIELFFGFASVVLVLPFVAPLLRARQARALEPSTR